jgi:hypothetical protein
MADLGWTSIIMMFHSCANPRDAAKILAKELRSGRPLGKSDREELARLVEGSSKPVYEAHCELKVVPRRDSTRRNNEQLTYEALARMDELCEEGKSIEDAACIASKEISLHAPETLRKKYHAYRAAIIASREP